MITFILLQKRVFHMNFLKIVGLTVLFMGFYSYSLDLSAPGVDVKSTATIAVNNCIVPMAGVAIPCEIEAEENVIKINTLHCSDKEKPFYCLRCLERIPIDVSKGSQTKECTVYNFAGTPLDPKK